MEKPRLLVSALLGHGKLIVSRNGGLIRWCARNPTPSLASVVFRPEQRTIPGDSFSGVWGFEVRAGVRV